MPLLDDLNRRAQTIYPRILLPESSDSRVIEAVKSISDQKLAEIILFDSETTSLLDVDTIDPNNEDLKVKYAQTLFELRKHKGVTIESALEMLDNPTVFAMIALKRGEVDGVVTGAITPSQEVLSSALRLSLIHI